MCSKISHRKEKLNTLKLELGKLQIKGILSHKNNDSCINKISGNLAVYSLILNYTY